MDVLVKIGPASEAKAYTDVTKLTCEWCEHGPEENWTRLWVYRGEEILGTETGMPLTVEAA